jgi:hypothetical protein
MCLLICYVAFVDLGYQSWTKQPHLPDGCGSAPLAWTRLRQA